MGPDHYLRNLNNYYHYDKYAGNKKSFPQCGHKTEGSSVIDFDDNASADVCSIGMCNNIFTVFIAGEIGPA